jgi:membrane fusion protein (multidrug efflux system)
MAVEEVKKTWVDLKRCTILAPAHGQVARRAAQVGEAVNPENPLMVIVPFDQMWVEANFKEVQLKKMRLGQSVTMKSDTYGHDQIYHGKIIGISAGTGSVFSVLPPQNATGNWIKIVQRLPVRVCLNPEEIKRYPLRLGLSMDVKVDLHDQFGKMVPDPIAEKPIYETDIFTGQLEDSDQIVKEIIEANSNFTFATEKDE